MLDLIGRLTWEKLLERVRDAAWNDATSDDILASNERRIRKRVDAGKLRSREKAIAQFYLSLIHWRMTGVFEAPWKNLTEARIQFWEGERFCSITEFQAKLAEAMADQFPKMEIFRKYDSIFKSIPSSASRIRDLRDSDLQTFHTPGATGTLIAFSTATNDCLGSSWTMFYQAVAEPAGMNLVVLKDFNRRLFMKGIRSLGSKKSTLHTLRSLVETYSEDTEVIFLGASGGTFGALAYAAQIPEIRRVVALSGPTSLELGGENEDKVVYKAILEEVGEGSLDYVDIIRAVRTSSLKRIDFFVSGHNDFDMAQMNHLRENTEVVVPHIYNTDHHSMTDLCVADGRLLRAVKGEDLTPIDLC